MPLCNMSELFAAAEREGRAVGSFSVGNLEMVLGAVRAAEELNTPVILQVAEVRLPYSPLALLGPMMLGAARAAKVPVAVHLDHGLTPETIREALELGFTSVMFDGSKLPLAENIARTREVVGLARRYGADVEAELGRVGGSEDGSEQNGCVCTDPQEAERFCRETGVDALAVAIGNAHGNYRAAPQLRFDVLDEIARRAPTPLVLHGGTGVTPADFQRCARAGIRKINIATASFDALARAAVRCVAEKNGTPGYFDLSAAMARGVYENVKRHIHIFNLEPLGEEESA